MKTTSLVLALGMLASALAARPAAAATASASIGITATVQASCLVSATAAAFRIYAAPADAASAVSVACGNSTPYIVTLSATSAPAATRDLQKTTGSRFVLLGYALSPNIRGIDNRGLARSAGAAAGFGSGSAPQLAFPGQRSSAEYAMAGAYADTLIILVTY